mmetsp:Transcript_882/g.2132  ORF Transcript_882/g.2132 Transcript_882/m.2132 type:complete len:99 (+) Transcript_882:71-367(+)
MRFLWLLLSVAASVSVEAPPADAALLVHLGEEEVAVVSVEASGQVEVGEDAGKCRDSERCKKVDVSTTSPLRTYGTGAPFPAITFRILSLPQPSHARS